MTRTVRCTASALILRELPNGPDTGRRLMHLNIASSHGLSHNGEWTFISAPAGLGWSATRFLEEVVDFAPTPAWPAIPHGRAGIVRVFGEPCSLQASSGRVVLPLPLPLSWDATKVVHTFACHPLVAPVMQAAFNEVHRRKLWAELRDYGGCYQCRAKRGTEQKDSTHSWGIAVDLDAARNPLGRKPVISPRIVAIFRDHGFTWGGDWSRPDGMHFQYATGY